ncbi:hypothetical protein RND71_014045 [Anisodus tanguticus]|uniref:Glutaredoxin domain-containing protein n=1 Tax=Anisodus tanguticus TaxID=243964 RepID=A0AAE1SA13_9SOLA|nr:hypothetical protein RND71_014045 [Anisodus tanguticus]
MKVSTQRGGQSIRIIEGSPKPLWEEITNSNDSSIVSAFDPEVISTFRKVLEDLPPANPFHLKPLVNGEVTEYKVGKDKLVVYFISLRGVRKTYEDCCHVRVILKGLGVKIDERDVSMHSGFKEELKKLLGNEYCGGGLYLPFLTCDAFDFSSSSEGVPDLDSMCSLWARMSLLARIYYEYNITRKNGERRNIPKELVLHE